MQEIYKESDLTAIVKQRRKVLGVFFIITAAYVLYAAAWLIYYVSLPYKDPMQFLPQVCVYPATLAYLVFAFLYLGIKFARVNAYYKMLCAHSDGIKKEEQAYYLGKMDTPTLADGVDVFTHVFTVWNKKKREWMNRETHVDVEVEQPQIKSGALVRYVSRGSFLLQYEVLEEGALDKELEKDEDED